MLSPEIGWAALRVLTRNGVEVLVPEGQSCCGALAAHTGVKAQAQRFARNNLRAFPDDVDAIITTAAGCGSGMHEYPLWLRGEPEEGAARAFAERVEDVSVFLHRLGLQSPPPLPEPLRAAYHDACHLAHAQRVTAPPRALLAQLGGLTLLELPESELCCGSAGTYNLEHPEIARQLGARKAEHILDAGAQLVVSGNIGCITQLQSHLRAQGAAVPVLHTVQLLDLAYRGA